MTSSSRHLRFTTQRFHRCLPHHYRTTTAAATANYPTTITTLLIYHSPTTHLPRPLPLQTSDEMRNSTIFAREYLEDLNAKREQAKDLCHLTITTYHLQLTT